MYISFVVKGVFPKAMLSACRYRMLNNVKMPQTKKHNISLKMEGAPIEELEVKRANLHDFHRYLNTIFRGGGGGGG